MSILLVLKSRSMTGPRQTINHQSKPNRSGIAEATGIPFLIWGDKALLEAVKVCRIDSLWPVWWALILHDPRGGRQFSTIRMTSVDAPLTPQR